MSDSPLTADLAAQIQERKAQRLQEIKSAADQYREILLRCQSPAGDDAKRLQELLPILGLSFDDAQGDVKAATALLESQKLLSDDAEEKRLMDEMQAQIKRARDIEDECQEKVQAAKTATSLAIAQHQRHSQKKSNARDKISELRRDFPRLFAD
ncbi:MAG: hypothetical protein ABSG31_18185 [Tepidisphaeraceae bacterium]|jgi:hypothetical protein